MRYSPEGKQLFQQLYSYKSSFPILPEELPDTPEGQPFSFGWSVAFEEERAWWADLSVQVDYCGNLRDIRTREMNTYYQAQKGYAVEQVGKTLSSKLGDRWRRNNPPL